MEKKEIIYLSIILGIFYALFLVLPTSAVVQVNQPLNNSNVSGTAVTFNVSWANTDIVNVTNITLTANTTLIGVISNTTGNPLSIQGTLSVAGITDGIYYINATVKNATINVTSTLVTYLVTIDNTAPTCILTRRSNIGGNRFDLSADNIIYDPSGSSDARSGISSCNISIASKDGSTIYASVQQSGSCSNTQTFSKLSGQLVKVSSETEVKTTLTLNDYLSNSCSATEVIVLTDEIAEAGAIIGAGEIFPSQGFRITGQTIFIGQKQFPTWIVFSSTLLFLIIIVATIIKMVK